MKKILLALLILLVIGFAACEPTVESEQNSESNEQETSSEESDNSEIGSQDSNSEVNVDIQTEDATVKVTNDAVEITTEDGTVEVSADDTNVEAFDEEVLVDNENITVSAESDGDTVSVTVDNKQTTVEVGAAPADINEWCVAGESYDYASDQGDVTSTVIGPATFKDEEYCEAQGTVDNEYIDIAYTYYFTYGGKKVWVVTDVAGQKTEVLVEN